MAAILIDCDYDENAPQGQCSASIQPGVVGVLARTPLADLHGSGGGFRHYVLFQPDPFGEFQQGNTEFLPVFQCHL